MLLEHGAYVVTLSTSSPLAFKHASCAKWVQTDISNVQDVQNAVDTAAAWARETGAPLSGVVCCAGIALAAKIVDGYGNPHSLDLWDYALGVNLTGSFNLTRLALPHIIDALPAGSDSECGIILFVSSPAAVRLHLYLLAFGKRKLTARSCAQVEGQSGQVAYAATKGALNAMVTPLAHDLAPYGIRVLALAPGTFRTRLAELIPSKVYAGLERNVVFPRRAGDVREFAEAVRWAIGCGVNGEVVRVSGAARLTARL
jgi:3-hydroxyacyl-CoA dehydrogenase/3-hydroxy-2-methylbutyryl-CoA dehydrogenase